MPVDARDYLRLLRDGYVSTIPHWQDLNYQLSKESPALVVELWALRREEKPTFEFVEDLAVIERMTAHLMTTPGVVGWWLEYCFKDMAN
jgi:hypothetical protein